MQTTEWHVKECRHYFQQQNTVMKFIFSKTLLCHSVDVRLKRVRLVRKICIVLCACICINTRILGFFSPYPQIALPLLGDMGALFKVLWLCKKLCVNFQEKSERKSLREFELIAQPELKFNFLMAEHLSDRKRNTCLYMSSATYTHSPLSSLPASDFGCGGAGGAGEEGGSSGMSCGRGRVSSTPVRRRSVSGAIAFS